VTVLDIMAPPRLKKMAVRLIAVLAVCLVLGGCVSQAQQQEGKPAIRVGIVNLDRVLPELPEYRDYSEKYVKERLQLYKDLKPNETDLKGYFTDKKRQEIEGSVKKWDELKRKFLERTREKVRAAADQVAREKKIDIVIVNAPWYPVSQRMAVDITTDIILALRESGKAVH